MKILLSIFTGLLGVLLLSNSASASASALELSISSPLDGARVDQRQDIIGEVSDPNVEIIVVIHPVSVSEFWTQPSVTVRNNGQWRVKVHFGRHGMDHGEEFEVRAFANPNSQTREGKYNSWPEAEARSGVVIVTRR